MLRFLTQFLPAGAQRTLRSAKRWIFGIVGIGLFIAGAMMLYPIGITIWETRSIPESDVQALFIGLSP